MEWDLVGVAWWRGVCFVWLAAILGRSGFFFMRGGMMDRRRIPQFDVFERYSMRLVYLIVWFMPDEITREIAIAMLTCLI